MDSRQGREPLSTNVELVRSIFSAWERGDFFSSGEWVHPEIEYVIADGPAPGRWTGVNGLIEGFRGWLSAWEEFRVGVDEYRELDDERVIVLYHFSGRGKTSGLELQQMQAQGVNLFYVHGHKVTKLVAYFDRERALAELGLSLEA